ncbi:MULTISPECIES: BofC C-terminal domain-containing protein [Paenibacillus]|uniref:BofC C-terminal domain-containing protein n=1 Tax=Paenibacillus TaxID=44249 RepID=UPI002FE07AFA
MNKFHPLKWLGKCWRAWRRKVFTICACGIVAFMAWLGLPLSKQMESLMTEEPLALEALGNWVAPDTSEEAEGWLEDLRRTKHLRIVHLNKNYTCGQESSVLGLMRPEEIEALAKQHPEWSGRLAAGGDVWFDEQVQGMSEICERDGYVGIDKKGYLSLFEGPPKQEKVIRTFFQLDVETMESALPTEVLEQLQNGIRIRDIEEYNSVLSTFSDYAVEASEGAMKPTDEE